MNANTFYETADFHLNKHGERQFDDFKEAEEFSKSNPDAKVYTVVDAEGDLYLYQGTRFVNRLYYYFTKNDIDTGEFLCLEDEIAGYTRSSFSELIEDEADIVTAFCGITHEKYEELHDEQDIRWMIEEAWDDKSEEEIIEAINKAKAN
jgi:hypothetical protein